MLVFYIRIKTAILKRLMHGTATLTNLTVEVAMAVSQLYVVR